MSKFFADMHIHSKYSKATSKNLDLENIYIWAKKKGISVIGTGDFTHPLWIQEIKDKLSYNDNGLLEIKKEIKEKIDQTLPNSCKNTPVYFILQAEISTIYKKQDKTHKVHHIIFAPTVSAVEQIISKLSKIGNLVSDGRPILSIKSRDLLEIIMHSSQYSYLIPAHI